MKRLLLFSIFAVLVVIKGFGQSFQWATKQEKALSGPNLASGDSLVAIIGTFHGTITLGAQTFISKDSIDSYLAVYNHTGQLLWAKHIISQPYQSTEKHHVVVDHNQNVIVSGVYNDSLYVGSLIFKATSFLHSGRFIVKFNSAGALDWARQAPVYDVAYNPQPKVSVDETGNIYLTGTFDGFMNFGIDSLSVLGSRRPFIAKFTPTGSIVWLKNPGNFQMAGTSVSAIKNGYFYFAGATFGPHTAGGIRDWLMIRKYDVSGAEVWTRFGFSWQHPESISLVVDASENAYLTGETFDFISFEAPSSGPLLLPGNGNRIFMAKINPAGKWIWAKKIVTGNYQSGVNQLYYSAANKLAFAGTYLDSISIAGSHFTTTLAGKSNSYIALYDTAGTVTWAINKNIMNTGLSGNSSGDFFISGQFGDTVSFNNINLTTTSLNGSGYLAKFVFNNTPAGFSEIGISNKEFNIYPNPASFEANLSYSLPKHFQKAHIVIREIATGREITKYELKSQKGSLTVDVSQFRNGLYLYSLVVDEKPVATKKLAVMK